MDSMDKLKKKVERRSKKCGVLKVIELYAKDYHDMHRKILKRNSEKSRGIPMMEDCLALKLIDSVVKRCCQKFGVRADSKVIFDEMQKQFREEVALAISDVFAIVPDGYKKLSE